MIDRLTGKFMQGLALLLRTVHCTLLLVLIIDSIILCILKGIQVELRLFLIIFFPHWIICQIRGHTIVD